MNTCSRSCQLPLAGMLTTLLMLGAQAYAADTPSSEVLNQGLCGSVVERHCHLKYVPNLPVESDTSARASADVPGHWEAVRNTAYDDDEIIIEGQGLHEPSIKEILQRYLGPSGPEPRFVSHPAQAGARCTVDNRTGMRICSHGGDTLPAAPGINTDFSDTVF